MSQDAATRQIRETSAGWLLQRLARRVEQDMEQRLAPLGLSVGAFAILMHVLEHPGQTQAGCCAAHAMPPYAVSRALDQLAAAGLIERRPDPTSRRAHAIHPTSAALSVQPQLHEAIRQTNAQLLAGLTPPESLQFLTMLSRLVAGFSR
jgi:DNA-binding MarR family transcriptional regulator